LRKVPEPADKYNAMVVFSAIAMLGVLPLIVLSVAPAKAVSRRVLFLAIGLLLLIALNELSKLAPMLQKLMALA